MTTPPQSSTRRLTTLVMLGLGLLACSKRRQTPDDTLVVIVDTTILDLDPRFTINNYDIKLSHLVAPGLTTTDSQTMEPQLALAEAITPVDDTTWDVRLHAGQRFSDGTPLTAKDVVYTFESVLDPTTESMHEKAFAERFAAVEALDSSTIRFRLHKPLGTIMTDLDFGIVSARAARRQGGRFPTGEVIGAGPFRVVSFYAERVEFERNPHYRGPAPPLARLTVRTVRDDGARALMLVGGSADLTQNSVRVDLVDEVAKQPRVRLQAGPSAILSYFMLHNQHPILSKRLVRQAIAHAIDRERIMKAKFSGHAVLATGLLPKAHWAYNADVPRYSFDPTRARQLLDEAGYPDPDGPGGKPRFRLVYKTSSSQFRVAVARIIAAQLGDVGIDVEVRAFEFGTFFSDIKKGNFEIASMQTASIIEPDWYYAYFHSSRIPADDNPHVNNRWRFRSVHVDELLERGRHETRRDKRLVLYREVQEILAHEVPIIPLWHEDNIALTNVDVSGYRVSPDGGFAGLTQTAKR